MFSSLKDRLSKKLQTSKFKRMSGCSIGSKIKKKKNQPKPKKKAGRDVPYTIFAKRKIRHATIDLYRF